MKKIDENLKLWRDRYDIAVHTLDDREAEEIIKNKCDFIFFKIETLLIETDKKAVIKATKGLNEESIEYHKAYHNATEENSSKEFYKDLKKSSQYATSIRSTISDIFELKNRRSLEVFKLRAENAKLKQELEQLMK